jgi:hypothetical protein
VGFSDIAAADQAYMNGHNGLYHAIEFTAFTWAHYEFLPELRTAGESISGKCAKLD